MGLGHFQTLVGGHAGTEHGGDLDQVGAIGKRRARLDRPVALESVQVGVADPAADQLHQGLTWAGLRHGNLVESEVVTELPHHGGAFRDP